eukprot:c23172_g1_i2 orf=108-446(-)
MPLVFRMSSRSEGKLASHHQGTQQIFVGLLTITPRGRNSRATLELGSRSSDTSCIIFINPTAALPPEVSHTPLVQSDLQPDWHIIHSKHRHIEEIRHTLVFKHETLYPKQHC